jgi:hypothetical protein
MTTYSQRRNCPISKEKKDLRDSAKELILKADSGSETNDKDYVFFHFIFELSAQRAYRTSAFGNYISGYVFHSFSLNALASTTAIDIYKRNLKEEAHLKCDKVLYFVLGVVAYFLPVSVPY